MLPRLWLLCLLAFAGALWPALAVEDESRSVSAAWQFRAWQTDDGLPDNSVTGVAQGADGFLWVGTFGGLMRFNGARFEEFSLSHLPEVPNRVVRQLLLEPGGRFWLAMDRGVVIRADARAARVFARRDARIVALAADGTGTAWLAYADAIAWLNEESLTPVHNLPAGGNCWVAGDGGTNVWAAAGNQLGRLRAAEWTPELTFRQPGVRMRVAREGGLWICADNSLLRLKPATGVPELVAALPLGAVVQAMLEDQSGAVWLGTAADGLFRWGGGPLERVPTSHSQISCLAEDREGNLWAGTAGGGLNRILPRFVEVIGAEDGLPVESLRSVCEDTAGVRWAATDNGLLLRGVAGRWSVAGTESGWGGYAANCVSPDPAGGVWVGTTSSRLVRLRNGRSEEWRRPQGLTGNYVRSVLVARNGDVWVASGAPSRLHRLRGGTLQALETPDDLRSIRALAQTTDGAIWAGTAEGQLLRVAPDSTTVESVFTDDPQLSIRCLSATDDGALWIGYAGWGVGRWKDGAQVRVTAAEGLFDDYVSQLLPDGRGNLWFNGNHGLFVARLSELSAVAEGRAERVRCLSFGRGEGLPSLQPRCDYFPSAWRMADGALAFALRNGLLLAQPGKLRENALPPAVVIEQIAVDERAVARHAGQFALTPARDGGAPALPPAGGRLELPPRHQKLEFGFAALSFSSPENVQFRCRLEPFDLGWNEAVGGRNARYPRLPAGDYEFTVQASTSAGGWSEPGARVRLRVLPFFWQTWWFRLAVVALFTAGVIGLVRYFSFRRLRRKLARLEQQELLHRERARIARDMHDEVGAKLSRLSLLSDLASQQPALPTDAQREVGEISETAREAIRSFDEIVWAVNPRNDTLGSLANYLCRFAEEFFEGSGVQCTFDLPPEIPARELSTEERHHVFLAAKEALNNVAKHAGARNVFIRVRLLPDAYELQIADDGRGFEAGTERAGGGNGLRNMRERMQLVGGEFALAAGAGQGTRVTLRVPLAAEEK